MAKSNEVKSTEDLMFALAQDFDRKDIKWRIQRMKKDGTAGLVLAYVDVRKYHDRLNIVMGANWQCNHINYGAKTICSIGLKLDNEWIWRSDGAGDTQIESDKGAISDSFKRASVLWGLGRGLYDLPSVWVDCESKIVNGKPYFKKYLQDPWDKVKQAKSDFS